MKINRHRRHRSADNIWPPRRTCDEYSFHQRVVQAANKKEATSGSRSADRHQCRKISNSTDNISIDTHQRVGVAIAECDTSHHFFCDSGASLGERKISQLHIWPPSLSEVASVPMSMSGERNEHKGKKFYLPEEKIHTGEVDELIKQRFEGGRRNEIVGVSSSTISTITAKENHGIVENIKCAHDSNEMEMVSGKRRLISSLVPSFHNQYFQCFYVSSQVANDTQQRYLQLITSNFGIFN